MYLESDKLNRLRDDEAALAREVEQLAARTGGSADDPAAKARLEALRERLERLREELNQLELAEEIGRQHDA